MSQRLTPCVSVNEMLFYKGSTLYLKRGSRMQKLTSMNELSRAVGVSTTSLRRWIEMGEIPAPRFTGSGGANLFTSEQVEQIQTVAAERLSRRSATTTKA